MTCKNVSPDQNKDRLDQIAAGILESDDYRVLRRLDVRRLCHEDEYTPVRRGVFLEVETTGLDSNSDEAELVNFLDAARKTSFRVFAVSAAFEKKDTVKNRGCAWNTDPRFGL